MEKRSEAINPKCFFGLPLCGFGFESSRHCFVACPSDDEFQLELEVIKDELANHNYEAYIAVEQFKGGKNIFCTKICSKIISSHFCLVLLNESRHRKKNMLIPNPNVHFEYGLICSLHKYVIPMKRQPEELSFNVSPLDTIVYSKSDFRSKLATAVSDAVKSFAGGPTAPQSTLIDRQIIEFMSLRGSVLADLVNDMSKMLYDLGGALGFFLFTGQQFTYFANAETLDERRIAFYLRLLSNNIDAAVNRIVKFAGETVGPGDLARWLLPFNNMQIVVIVDKTSNRDALAKFGHQLAPVVKHGITVELLTRDELATELEAASDSIVL